MKEIKINIEKKNKMYIMKERRPGGGRGRCIQMCAYQKKKTPSVYSILASMWQADLSQGRVCVFLHTHTHIHTHVCVLWGETYGCVASEIKKKIETQIQIKNLILISLKLKKNGSPQRRLRTRLRTSRRRMVSSTRSR